MTGTVRTEPPRAWTLLLPALYLAHLAEEVWAGGGLVAWMNATGIAPDLDEPRFFLINGVFLVAASAVAVAAALSGPRSRPLTVAAAAIGALFGLNGAIHLLASLATASYSPGTASGALLYLPFAAWLFGPRGPKLGAAERGVAWLGGLAIHVAAFLATR